MDEEWNFDALPTEPTPRERYDKVVAELKAGIVGYQTPAFRVEGGTVVVMLSHNSADILVLPVKELSAVSTYFQAALHGRWTLPKTIGGGEVPIYFYKLVYVDSWTLECQVRYIRRLKTLSDSLIHL